MLGAKQIFELFYKPKNHFDRIKTRDFLLEYVSAARNHKIKRALDYKWEDFICVVPHNVTQQKLRNFCLELSRQFHDANPQESEKQDFRYYSHQELTILHDAIQLLNLLDEEEIGARLQQLADQHQLGSLEEPKS